MANFPLVLPRSKGKNPRRDVTTGVTETGTKFASGISDTRGQFSACVLILVVHLDLGISSRIFEKIVYVL